MSNKNRILKVCTIGVRGGCGGKEEREGVCVVGGRREVCVWWGEEGVGMWSE